MEAWLKGLSIGGGKLEVEAVMSGWSTKWYWWRSYRRMSPWSPHTDQMDAYPCVRTILQEHHLIQKIEIEPNNKVNSES